jgi:MPBQ/MSBQ methyltransferase
VRLVQHKPEAYWFYRVLSIFYDNYVNPFFWTERMREEALQLAKLDARDLKVVDVGSGTGFTTLGIAAKVNPQNVYCIDQSPHQMQRARQKPALQQCHFQLGDAEDLPFETDSFDRYISAGSIEYWPEPQRGIAEAYRVLKPGGIALMIGPLRPQSRVARFFADLWMLFPEEQAYLKWFKDAGFADIHHIYIQPDWVLKEKYAIAIAGRKAAAGESPLRFPHVKAETVHTPMSFKRKIKMLFRLLVGNLAGFAFIPMAILGKLTKPIRMKIAKTVNPSAMHSDPLTTQQKIALVAMGLGIMAIIIWIFK